MILGVGLDVVNTDRVVRALAAHGRRFEQRVYTPAELADCAERGDRIQALAARFAAKEAFLKALGIGFTGGISLTQIEVMKADGQEGRPALRLGARAAARADERGVQRVHLSLSHQPGLAAAVVVLEG
jgi:holo-[acyl-carrier protein] synthase